MTHLSSQVLDRYLKDLDNGRGYFLANDIKEFEDYRYLFDDDLVRGDLSRGFAIYSRYQQRINQRLDFILKELKKGTDAFDFSKDDSLETKRENAPWAKSSEDLDKLMA